MKETISIQKWFNEYIESFQIKYPYYTYMLSKLTPVYDESINVMAVSCESSIFYLHVNIEYFSSRPQYILGVLLHEIHHVVLGHLSNPNFRSLAHPDLMEIAMEISASEHIAEPLPADGITLEKFREYGILPGQSTLERYNRLVNARLQGKFRHGNSKILDSHHGSGVGVIFCDQEHGKASKEPPSFIHDLVKGMVQDAVNNVGASSSLIAGKYPGKILEELNGVEEQPENFMDWKTALQAFAGKMRAPRHTYSRPNRRFPESVGCEPGRTYYPCSENRPSLLVAIDTSSSMSNKELSEVARHLIPISGLAKIKIVECDVSIHRVYPFNNKLEAVFGRGGTDFRPVFEPDFLRIHKPDGIIYFTDGIGPYPKKDPRINTLWVLTKPHIFKCPWGMKSYFKTP